MPRSFSDALLRRVRNEVAWLRMLRDLQWPHKWRAGQLAFVCPRCGEYRSAVNPRTNLGRCFHCETNFNPIDFTIAVQHCDFQDAVHYLISLLPPTASES